MKTFRGNSINNFPFACLEFKLIWFSSIDRFDNICSSSSGGSRNSSDETKKYEIYTAAFSTRTTWLPSHCGPTTGFLVSLTRKSGNPGFSRVSFLPIVSENLMKSRKIWFVWISKWSLLKERRIIAQFSLAVDQHFEIKSISMIGKDVLLRWRKM